MTYIKMFDEDIYKLVNKESKEALQDYILELKSKGRAEKTVAQYVFDIKAFLCYVYENIDNKSILDLKRRDFRSFFLFMKESGKSSARINRFMSSIRNFCQYLEDDEDDFEDYESNPMRKIKSIESEKVREIFFLTDEQVDFLIDYLVKTKQYQKAFYVEFSYSSGARRNEIYQVTKHSFLKDGNMTEKVVGKRGKQFNLVFSDRCKELAKLYLEQRGEDDIDSLWVTGKDENKRELGYDSLYNFAVSFRKILQEEYNEEIELNSHSFRHSFAENLENGSHHMLKQLGKEKLTLNEIRILMNHSSADMTQSYMRNKDDEIVESLFGN